MKKNTKQATLPLNQVNMSVTKLFRTQWNNPSKGGFYFNMPSLTTQDDAMTVEELYKTFGHGTGPVQVGRQLFYDGAGDDVDVNDCYLAGRHWESLDISEKHNILKMAENDFTRINQGIKKANEEKAKKLEAQRQRDTEERKQFQDWLKKQNATDVSIGAQAAAK